MKEGPTGQPAEEQPTVLFTPEQLKQFAADNSTLKGKYQTYFLDHQRLRYVYRLLDQCNYSKYLQDHAKTQKWSNLLVFAGMGAALLKPKSYTYKLIGMFSVMTLHIMILDHYNCRQRLKSISLQKTFTVEEQEIRNLYEFYYPDDSESKKIAALTQQCLEYRRIKQELNIR